MPMKAPRICGCGFKIASGEPCPCDRKRRTEIDRRRPSARVRGYDSRWEKERVAFLALPEHRYCVCGCGRRADTVDHIVPHRGDRTLFWSRSNWQPMAFSCHSSKKQREERRALTSDEVRSVSPTLLRRESNADADRRHEPLVL